MVIKNAKILDGNFAFAQGDIAVENGKITAIGKNLPEDDEVVNADGLMAIPGFVDIHTHGCVGYDTCDGDLDGYAKMCDFYASKGVTSFLFTSMTLDKERLAQLFRGIDRFCQEHTGGAIPEGIYFEGPFISHEKKGAQAGEYIIPPYLGTLKELDEASGGRIRVVALAPEVPGAMEFLDQATGEYVITLAHTTANYDTAMEAARRGAKLVTHLYNGMIVPTHREPGVPGAAFDAGMYTEVICDGFHLHPAVVRATFKNAGSDRVVLISDSMQAAGMPDGKYSLGGQDVFVQDGKATLASGTIAGSSSNLLNCFRNVVSWGIPIETASKAASLNPAKAAGLDGLAGSLEPGKYADILLMDDELNLKAVYIRGEKAYWHCPNCEKGAST